jgi:nitrogen fixation/metabolism regulation signal transduction histidine kinase
MATLINIYTLIFFISGICAILISNSIINSFRLLIDQFRMIRLQHNALLHWPHRDELGLLVKEYNAMIIKVEDMASKLASTEREAAWRELALQVAHEIKNPLTPMKLNIQYLQKAIKTEHADMGPLTVKLTDSLIEQIENMNVIATEFAHFAKMPDAQPECLHVSDMLHSIVALFQKNEEIKIELMEDSTDLCVLMDKGYFLRIFTNLIKNAIQAIPDDESGQISIRIRRNNHKVEIRVADNGSGIPEAMQKKLFTPYFTTKSSGTGIGLAMSKNMIELSNGKIWFETQAGKGTTFFVSLPNYIPDFRVGSL